MKVVVFGASGKVGKIVVANLLNDGYHVRAFVHSSNPFEDHAKLETIKGDIYAIKDVEAAVRGVDVVVSTLGSWGTKKKMSSLQVLKILLIPRTLIE